MTHLIELQDRILNINKDQFLPLVFEVYHYQRLNNPVYAEYLKLLNKYDQKINSIEQIPFLPSEVFKHRKITTGIWEEENIFESSGTSQSIRSRHYIKSLEWYFSISKKCFEFQYGSLQQFTFLGLLPSFQQKPESSLACMFWNFTGKPNNIKDSLTFFNNEQALWDELNLSVNPNKKTTLFGLSFALMDFIEKYHPLEAKITVIETGGMKSQRREMDKTEVLKVLKKGFPNSEIHSEYGMTELISQAYAMDGLHYIAAPTMQFLISDPTDPSQILETGKRGVVNVIDLGNLFSCAFIQTGDLGILDTQNRLRVLGRYQQNEMRGCVQLYE